MYFAIIHHKCLNRAVVSEEISEVSYQTQISGICVRREPISVSLLERRVLRKHTLVPKVQCKSFKCVVTHAVGS